MFHKRPIRMKKKQFNTKTVKSLLKSECALIISAPHSVSPELRKVENFDLTGSSVTEICLLEMVSVLLATNFPSLNRLCHSATTSSSSSCSSFVNSAPDFRFEASLHAARKGQHHFPLFVYVRDNFMLKTSTPTWRLSS
jgi:hypothetical protein